MFADNSKYCQFRLRPLNTQLQNRKTFLKKFSFLSGTSKNFNFACFLAITENPVITQIKHTTKILRNAHFSLKRLSQLCRFSQKCTKSFAHLLRQCSPLITQPNKLLIKHVFWKHSLSMSSFFAKTPKNCDFIWLWSSLAHLGYCSLNPEQKY